MGAATCCPVCREPVNAERGKRPPDYPFCSERCRLVDLGRWLSGSYRIPGEPAARDPEKS